MGSNLKLGRVLFYTEVKQRYFFLRFRGGASHREPGEDYSGTGNRECKGAEMGMTARTNTAREWFSRHIEVGGEPDHAGLYARARGLD